jgi:iron complex transport system ATP-binding protein
VNRLHGENLSVTLDGRQVLDGLSFELQSGEMLGLIGPNGAGKTTLLRTLAGLLKPSAGAVTLDGRDFHAIKPKERARQIAYLAQSGTAHWPMSVARIVELGRAPHLSDWQRPSDHDSEIISRAIRQTDLTGFEHRIFNTLSGGEKARVLLARALAAEPGILLADEPVAALDLSHQLDVMSLLGEFCQQGGAVVVVLHDLRLAAHYCHRVQLLVDGQTLASGPPGDVLSEANMGRAFGLRTRGPGGSTSSPFSIPWEKQ